MRRMVMVGGALAALGVIAVAAGLFWFFNGDEPEAASVDAALARGAATAAATTAAGASIATAAASSDPIGTYKIVAGATTFAGYRLKEELQGVGSNIVVGRTGEVTGSLTFDGKAITAVDITVQTANIKTDDSRRDSQNVRGGLQTATFPTAKFVLAQPVVIASLPAEGAKVKFDVVGDFTLHGVTKRVTVPLEGARQAGNMIVAGSLEIALADYAIRKPTSPSVLSIDDKGSMEFQLVFRK